MDFITDAKAFLVDHLKHFDCLPMEFEFEGVVYDRDEYEERLGVEGIKEVRREAFDWEKCEDYIASHGFGPADAQAQSVARELWEEGDDYATIGHEIVARGLTFNQI
ncbi:hypothetical protein DET61_11686 [Marinobacter nauticus]|uniref:Uncharacterized protein n=1 Tax=Marinobacter nauticus TaxID=2743 RepID=A0A368X886_MARNT|nr:hypothetical protein [Marinobacter nauticus]RCW64045.1 hypothetical protein DET61_11686 [Marinobacter nauticus]